MFGHAAPAWGQDSVVCESVGISKLRCARRLGRRRDDTTDDDDDETTIRRL